MGYIKCDRYEFYVWYNPEFNNGGSPSINNWIHLKLLICSMFYQSSFNQDIGTKVVTVNRSLIQHGIH
jgi:hypothetical protein